MMTTAPKKRLYRKKVSTKAKAKASLVTTAMVKKIVNRQIDKNVEDKYVSYTLSNVALCNILNTSWLNIGVGILPISPRPSYLAISQGTGQANRLGNSIRIKKVYMNLVMWPLPYQMTTNANPRPLDIQLIFFKTKGQSSSSPSITDFFQLGNSNTTFQGTLVDLTRTVNKDKFIYLGQKKYKLGYAEYNGTGTNTAQQGNTNNDYKMNIITKLDVTKYLNKIYKFNDTDNSPFTNDVYCTISGVNADNSSISGAVVPANYTVEVTMTYEDA